MGLWLTSGPARELALPGALEVTHGPAQAYQRWIENELALQPW